MFRTVVGFAAVLALVSAWGCGEGEPNDPAAGGGPASGAGSSGETSFTIDFPGLENGFIPEKHTGHGADVSPRLRFLNVPKNAVELALIVDDPDAPTEDPWVHWVVYGIPGDSDGLPEGFTAPTEGAIREGRNSWPTGKTIGWRGPLPPSGTHRYVFHLHALSRKLDLPAGATKEELMAAIRDISLESAELEARFAAR